MEPPVTEDKTRINQVPCSSFEVWLQALCTKGTESLSRPSSTIQLPCWSPLWHLLDTDHFRNRLPVAEAGADFADRWSLHTSTQQHMHGRSGSGCRVSSFQGFGLGFTSFDLFRLSQFGQSGRGVAVRVSTRVEGESST